MKSGFATNDFWMDLAANWVMKTLLVFRAFSDFGIAEKGLRTRHSKHSKSNL